MTGQSSPVVVTKSERLLSWILAGFLLLALSWAYVNIDDKVREHRADGLHEIREKLEPLETASRADARQLGLYGTLSGERLYELLEDRDVAREDRDTARERYRTSLDEGVASARLKRAYLAADDRATEAQVQYERLAARNKAASAKHDAFKRGQAAEIKAIRNEIDDYRDTTDRIAFILRLMLTLGTLGLSVWLLRAVTERSPRAQPLAQAGVIAGGLMLLTLIIDYSEISFDFETVGPLGMALLGVILTVGAFFGLQRYLRNSRPNRRLRAGECAACGYPGGTDFCENCGEQLTTKCSECGESRRTGTGHCRACGAA